MHFRTQRRKRELAEIATAMRLGHHAKQSDYKKVIKDWTEG